jgi:C-terminal processing protease CtpA/Prc
MARFNLTVNYGRKEIHMLPNSHFNEAFDYSYTGLGIYMIEGRVVIEDVLKDSPGEKAGLMPGDIIIAIDNNVTGNIQTYKNMLQAVGARLKILVNRDGKPMMTTLKVVSIM